MRVEESAPVALVTGASSGLGQATARRLAEHGFRVFGTSRRERPNEDGVEMLVLDVRSPSSVEACVERLVEEAGRIDVLVNNAGTAHLSIAEETDEAAVERVLDTNLRGVLRMTRAVLPLMRRQGRGRIINVSSLAGLIGVPGQAYYAASKHAVEGFTESLRHEVESLDIHVSLVEPGFHQTGLVHDIEQDTASTSADYNEIRSTVEEAVTRGIEEGDDPERVAEEVAEVAQAESPRLRYRVGGAARWIPRLKKWLPDSLFAMGLRRRFGLA